tara:strand:- start:23127 stop:24806 length:1680 start_codon:yes stop_codon:yes gene_type:complete
MDSPRLADHELDELCRLLIGTDRERLKAAIERMHDRGQFIDWQSQTLADAMRLALARDPTFADSMAALISKGVHTTVQHDSTAFGRALAPALGPAIRNSVWMMLQGFVQSIETIVDQQLSWRSVRWRIEGWRTGRSFAEVAFVHTLLFRVEHVFLLHRSNGLQLQHCTRPGAIAREPDLITAMLTAIQDFLRDAFQASESDAATSFSINELSVIVENGNNAALAAVVRGQPRAEIRLQLREALDRIESTMTGQLAKFDGDTDPFEAVRPQLEACLTESQRTGVADAKKKKKRSKVIPFTLLVATLGLITWWIIGLVATATLRGRFENFVAELTATKGYAITNSEIRDDAVIVHGLRDPLAQPFEEIATKHSVKDLVTTHFQDYHALHPEFVAQRIRKTLKPPAGVEFDLDGRTLHLRGSASHAWLERTGTIAAAIDGISSVDITGCTDLDLQAFQEAAARLLAADPKVALLQDANSEERRTLVQLVRELTMHAIRIDRNFTLQASFVSWSDDTSSSDAQAARAVVADLSRIYGMDIQLSEYVANTGATDSLLRFTAKLR